MKKIYLFLIATCLSLSGLFAQAHFAGQEMNSIPDEINLVGSRNNAPQASYSYHYSFDEDGSIETWCFFKGSRRGLTSLSLIDIIWLPLPNDDKVQMQFSMSYSSSVGQTKYGQIVCPPVGTYTIVTSVSNMDASSKMWAGGDLSYGEVTSGTGVGYFYNVVADDLYQSNNIYTTGHADSWISYDGSSTTTFRSGSFTVEPGRHGYPYIYSTSLKDVNNNSLDITINDSRNLTTTYISAEMIPNREEMTVSLSGDDGNGNQMKFVFNVSDFNENGSVPAGTYSVGTDVSGMVYDLDGFTSWQLSRGTVTIAYDSEGRLTMSVSSLYGLSDGVEYTLNLSMNGINVSSVVCPEVVYFISNGDLYASNLLSEGTNTAVYQLGWFKDGDASKRPGLQMSFCFSKSDIRYMNGKVVPPDGTYPFHPGNLFMATLTNSSGYSTEAEVTTVNNHTVAGYQWILLEDDQFNRISVKSSFLDESNTRYYLNSGYVTVSTQSDGVHIVVEANGGTDPGDVMNLPFKFIIQPNPCGYKFEVSEIVGEGSVTKTPEKCLYQENSQIILTPTPADGWTFSGWTGDCANQIVDNGDGTYTFTVPAQDCAVIANFEESIGYTLTWDFNGGVTTSQDNEYTHGKIPEGEFIVAPADPTLDGYQFAGWLNSVTNVVETAEAGMMPSLMPDEDLTYIAQWTANACAYTVHFDSNGGSGTMTDQELTCGVADNLIPNEFTGPAATITYNYHGATSGDDEPSVTVNKPFGVWEDNVVEELHDDEEEIDFSVSNGATVTMTAQWDAFLPITLPTPEKTGYIFNGWYTEETGGTKKGEGGASFSPAGDITLHAQWTANTYTVHFDSNHGEAADEMGDQTFTYDVEQALIANGFDWTGHTFQGWATEENGDVVYTDQQTVSNLTTENNATVNLYAVWETNSYTVTFQDTEADGGNVWWSGDFAYGETPVYGGENEPSKADDSQYSYEFAGWKDIDGVVYTTGTDLPAVTGEATYYAVYNQTVQQYTLAWDVNDGDALAGDYTQGDVEWGTAIIAPEDPTKEGYQFAGWLSSITNEVETPSVMPAADLTYTAQWTANTYTVHFDSNHGEAADEMGDQTFTYDVEQALTANGYEWTGHTFQGWATEENGDVVYTDQQTVSNLTTENNATVNLYAVWETNSYTVTFQDTEADGGTEWWSGDFAYGETPVYGGTEMPSKAGDSQYSYEFAGWKDVDGVEYPTGTDLPAVTAEATYYAVYNQTVLQYTLTWDVNDGDALTGDYTQGDVEWGTAISAPDDPTKEGYQFGGWVSSITNEVEIPSEMPAADLTYTAQWTANTYTVHFDSNHGEAADEMGDQTFTYDVEQALTANGFDWTGHTFLGWATEENGGVVYTDQQTVSNLTAENNAIVNLYAVWEINSYTITFQDTEADGGTEWWSGDFAYGETPVYGGENEPSKESTDEHTYTFTGWTDGVNEYVGTALPEVTDNAVYYAVYSESDALFTVRFENPDGSELQTYQLPLGSTPAYEGTPVQENEGDAYNYYMFTFTGWVDSNDNSYGTDDALPAVTGDITYTAQYSKQLFIILQEQKDDDYYTEFSEKYSGERATTATLNRQFAQGKWATLCLPFNVSKALMTAVGLQNRVYEFKYTKGDTQSGITLYFALASKMEAGKGYIVNANAVLAQKTQLVFYSVLVDTQADVQSGYDISALSGYNSEGNIYLVGTLRRGVLYGDQGNGNYYLGLSNNKIFAANSTTGTNVLAYRGIFRSTEPISAPRVRIVAEGEDGEIVGELEVVTGELEEVTAPKKYVQDGILYIERDGIRYSAQGQRLD